ncbi:hypothetical protein TNCV_3918111 [Trichonephila clavipes]|nr:hypothetical protein TNCV_3918111 [Trichonephila clavipes]
MEIAERLDSAKIKTFRNRHISAFTEWNRTLLRSDDSWGGIVDHTHKNIVRRMAYCEPGKPASSPKCQSRGLIKEFRVRHSRTNSF